MATRSHKEHAAPPRPTPQRNCEAMPKTLTITTLTNKTLTFEGCDQSLELLQAQEKYQDREGVAPKSQRLWFPVIEGGRPATEFVWWKDTAAKLPAELKERLLASPLKKWEDETLGEIADLQGAGDSPINCFVILQLAELPAGEEDGTGMKDAQAEQLERTKDDVVYDIEQASDDEEQTEHLTKAFAVFDVDKNGKLSRQELKDILTRMDNNDSAAIRKIDEDEADEIIDDLIKNNNGQELSVDEYIKAMRKFVPVK